VVPRRIFKGWQTSLSPLQTERFHCAIKKFLKFSFRPTSPICPRTVSGQVLALRWILGTFTKTKFHSPFVRV